VHWFNNDRLYRSATKHRSNTRTSTPSKQAPTATAAGGTRPPLNPGQFTILGLRHSRAGGPRRGGTSSGTVITRRLLSGAGRAEGRLVPDAWASIGESG
jgi:hypothetical protein